ncbi:MAG: cell envelope integrity protein TolA [Deltaproteobacteria bacterium]|nr:cell envelope integrity protein TolA [Deltaproteobacteria bacterium]
MASAAASTLDDERGLARFLTVSAAVHAGAILLALFNPWSEYGTGALAIPAGDTVEVTLTGVPPLPAPVPRASGPASALPGPPPPAPPPPKTEAAIAPRSEPPSVDQAAIPLETKSRSLEDRKRLEKAEQSQKSKAAAVPAPKTPELKTAPTGPAETPEKSARSELEEKLRRQLEEARQAIAKAKEYGTGGSTNTVGTTPAEQSPQSPGPAGTGASAGVQSGRSGSSLLASADRVQQGMFDSYRAQIIAAVRDNWDVPASVKGLTLEAVFRIELSPDGDVAASRLVKSSGNRVFDDAVSRAVARVTNVGIPPAGFPRSVNIVFDNRSLDQ